VVKVYPAFKEFYGMEETIERVVSYTAMALRAWKKRSRSSICWARWGAARARLPSGSSS
jgi:predicted Ser/Thr protein kinase